MVALMPCKFFVSFCGSLVVVRHWVVVVVVVCVLILLVFCVGLVSVWLGRKVVFRVFSYIVVEEVRIR